MSYTRSAWKRTYCSGKSNLYSFIGEDGNLWVMGYDSKDGFEVIKKEDVVELIVSVLEHAGIKLNEEQLKKLANELEVKLRKKPLSWEEIWNDMKRKSKKR